MKEICCILLIWPILIGGKPSVVINQGSFLAIMVNANTKIPCACRISCTFYLSYL